ncbi:MAG: methanethiol S-methyltransferase [Pseudomonadales bacterium]
MKRSLLLTYGIFSYVVFLGTFLYALGFVGNFIVPKGIDSEPQLSTPIALAIDVLLLALFALQHSIMARPAFKRWWTRLIPAAVERSTYTLFSSLALIVLFVFWQPLGGVVWQVDNPIGVFALWTGFGFGWLLVLISTFLINHFDLFGLRQVWTYFRGQLYTPLRFGTPGPYKLVRHPLYLGWLFAFWCIPVMTITHLVFALVTTAYILLAIRWEERDLVTALGEDYRAYRREVPMIVPLRFPSMQKRAQSPAEQP